MRSIRFLAVWHLENLFTNKALWEMRQIFGGLKINMLTSSGHGILTEEELWHTDKYTYRCFVTITGSYVCQLPKTLLFNVYMCVVASCISLWHCHIVNLHIVTYIYMYQCTFNGDVYVHNTFIRPISVTKCLYVLFFYVKKFLPFWLYIMNPK